MSAELILRKFQRHWLLRQYGVDGQVLPENLEVSAAIDDVLSALAAADEIVSLYNMAWRASIGTKKQLELEQAACERHASRAPVPRGKEPGK